MFNINLENNFKVKISGLPEHLVTEFRSNYKKYKQQEKASKATLKAGNKTKSSLRKYG